MTYFLFLQAKMQRFFLLNFMMQFSTKNKSYAIDLLEALILGRWYVHALKVQNLYMQRYVNKQCATSKQPLISLNSKQEWHIFFPLSLPFESGFSIPWTLAECWSMVETTGIWSGDPFAQIYPKAATPPKNNNNCLRRDSNSRPYSLLSVLPAFCLHMFIKRWHSCHDWKILKGQQNALLLVDFRFRIAIDTCVKFNFQMWK